MSAYSFLPHDRSAFFDTSKYWNTVERFFLFEIENDGEDITSHFCFDSEKKALSHLVAKQSGILAGSQEILFFFQKKDPDISIQFSFEEGESFSKNDVLAVISGNAKKIMQYERVILNVLSRMSGIATQTQMIQSCSKTPLASTRKTHWSYLDKKAVHIGGGLTHRIGLFDGVLMKENHHLLTNSEFLGIKALQNFSEYQRNILKKTLFFEREVETKEELFQAIEGSFEFFAMQDDLGVFVPQVIMLDNFSSDQVHTALKELQQKGYHHSFRKQRSIFLECSGGITVSNISEYDRDGIDVLSLGVLTSNAPSLDFSLRIQE